MSLTGSAGHQHPDHDPRENRAAIWISVFVVMAGSIIAAVALIEWIWPLFWIGAGVMVLGGLSALLAGVLDDVEEYGPSQR